MSISIGSNSLLNSTVNTSLNSTTATKLEDSLSNKSNSSDKELLESCKQFESYLVEQVFKEMKKTVPENEDENNEYLKNFGDILYENYAKNVTEGQGLGIAKMLYESMKR
ncbi:rod-binding protein [Anaeromicropila herbilytica]|uniref:Flagellar protein FlgJ N-terminal domain-containing protein n=1 Tax=Anaeromicropila herbilytica TaxID=2785025 RepID=A0A7R7EJ00_9FIRM|nr:rod-binding protein [Anaeromicropila herbilytica]BCN29640.1 hypothetical protein bsdtb5_09350 [Anaeromicropila herbilytica]